MKQYSFIIEVSQQLVKNTGNFVKKMGNGGHVGTNTIKKVSKAVSSGGGKVGQQQASNYLKGQKINAVVQQHIAKGGNANEVLNNLSPQLKQSRDAIRSSRAAMQKPIQQPDVISSFMSKKDKSVTSAGGQLQAKFQAGKAEGRYGDLEKKRQILQKNKENALKNQSMSVREWQKANQGQPSKPNPVTQPNTSSVGGGSKPNPVTQPNTSSVGGGSVQNPVTQPNTSSVGGGSVQNPVTQNNDNESIFSNPLVGIGTGAALLGGAGMIVSSANSNNKRNYNQNNNLNY